jgi:TrkA domain protein
MPEIDETRLPGVGTRYDFACQRGPRVGVMNHPSGRRDLLVYDQDDPDAVLADVPLNPEEASALAELLGAASIVEQLDALPQLIAGLAIEWASLPTSVEPATIGSLEIRRRTGASVVAIVRDDAPLPAPGPDEDLRPGDTVVMVGTPDGLASALELIGA